MKAFGHSSKKLRLRISRDQPCSIGRRSKGPVAKSKVRVDKIVRKLGLKNMGKTQGLSKVIEANVLYTWMKLLASMS
jgi:hypothetical protein